MSAVKGMSLPSGITVRIIKKHPYFDLGEVVIRTASKLDSEESVCFRGRKPFAEHLSDDYWKLTEYQGIGNERITN